MTDLHGSKDRIESCLKNQRKNPEISEEHKQLFEDFNNQLIIQDLSDARRFRYLNNLKRIMEYNSGSDLDLTDYDASSVRKVLVQIEESAYYSKEYSEKTKDGYRGAIKKVLKLQGKDPDELVGEDFTWSAKAN
ncbi:MAG: hypothetical protein ABEJ02_03280 [Candidatus Paceibacteria bacterium]